MYYRPFRCAALALSLSLTLALCACGSPAPAPAAGPAADIAASAADLWALTEGTAAGRYIVGDRDNGYEHPMLFWLDYAKAQVVPLCTAPNCAHDSEACTAWLPPEASVWAYAVDGDTLLKNVQTDDGFALYRCRADGSDPQLLYSNADQLAGSTFHPRYTDGTDVWCMATVLAQDGTMSQSLLRVPLAGGEAQTVTDIPLGATLLGSCGRSLVLQSEDYSDYDTVPVPDWSAAVTPEESKMMQEQYNAALDTVAVPCQVELLDADTGEKTTFLSWQATAEEMPHCLWQGDTLYRLAPGRTGSLQWDRTDGSSGSAAFDWPVPADGELSVEPVTVVEGRLIVRGDWYRDTGAAPEMDCVQIAIDPASGQTQQLTLGYYDAGIGFVPLPIWGRSADSLLVQFECQDAASSQQAPTRRWGLLTFADYFANRPNYREIDQTAGTVR